MGLNATVLSLLPYYHVLICGTYTLPQLWHFRNIFQIKLANKGPYHAGINSMRLRLQELQKANSKGQRLKQQKTNSYKEIDEIFHYQSLSFVLKTIQRKLINYHNNNSLACNFGIKKTCKLLAQKYY